MIPSSCWHGDRGGRVSPLPGCSHCGGSGRVDFVSDDFPPGTNACCCTCGRCRQKHDESEASRVTLAAAKSEHAEES